MIRTHDAGSLRASDAGQTVTIAGWVATRRDHGGVTFIDLRDRSGICQVVLRESDVAHDLRNEWVLAVTGEVRAREERNVNPNLPTGEIEVVGSSLTVLNEAAPLPFQVDAHAEVGEETRLKYRYLDLRRAAPSAALRLRSEVNRAARDTLYAHGFTEVETPTLTRSTPEGARDFLVPARLRPGSWYALPQSPQLFKQLLMVAGMERYFQIARCYRDEDFRADRQPEFTQLDIEMSFVDQDDVIALSEDVLVALWRLIGFEIETPIPRMTYYDAMDRYGTDKPDLRFGLELVELTANFAATEFNAFKAPYIGALRVEGQADAPRSRLDALTDRARQLGAKGLVWMRAAGEPGSVSLDSPVAKFLSAAELDGIVSATAAEPGDLVLIVADDRRPAQLVLGGLRNDLGRPPVSQGPYRYVWITEFPLFEGLDDAGHPVSAHHPFTMPHPEDIGLLDSDPLAVRSQSYDLVLNGWELGSGSIRIHRSDVQAKIFQVLGISAEEAEARFGFLLGAFRYGAPPHGGFAVGLDRLTAVLAGEDNIREVIAFPKTQSGLDPMTGAPKPLGDQQLRDLYIRVVPPPDKDRKESQAG